MQMHLPSDVQRLNTFADVDELDPEKRWYFSARNLLKTQMLCKIVLEELFFYRYSIYFSLFY